MTRHSTIVAGIDVAKSKLDLAVHGWATCQSVYNDTAGWQRIVDVLREAGVQRVGLEATGGYERDLTTRLRADGFEVLLLQPVQVRAFARLHLRRAKNDAALIAACTATFDAPGAPPDPRLAAYAGLLTFIEQIEEEIVHGKTRLQHIAAPRLRRLIEQDLARLAARCEAELRRLATALHQFDDLAARFDLVLSVPGIGERTAIALLVRLPELRQLSREQAAALARLASFDADSGTRQGQRHIAGGRHRLRRSLYAAAFRWNPPLKAVYARLTARSKFHKQALVACARKLRVSANTVVQRGSPWITHTEQT